MGGQPLRSEYKYCGTSLPEEHEVFLEETSAEPFPCARLESYPFLYFLGQLRVAAKEKVLRRSGQERPGAREQPIRAPWTVGSGLMALCTRGIQTWWSSSRLWSHSCCLGRWLLVGAIAGRPLRSPGSPRGARLPASSLEKSRGGSSKRAKVEFQHTAPPPFSSLAPKKVCAEPSPNLRARARKAL